MKKNYFNYIYLQYLIIFFLSLLLLFSLIDSPKDTITIYPAYYYLNLLYLLLFFFVGIIFTFVFTVIYKNLHKKIKEL